MISYVLSLDGGLVLNLEDEIELMRKAMIDAAAKEGLASDEAMEFSRILDSLINQYEARKGY